MNFIGACLLLHSDEVMAFHFLEMLLVEYELRHVYLGEFVGLYKHCKIIDALVGEKMPILHDHLKKQAVQTEMFCSDWLISLFTSTLPHSQTTRFFQLFFKDSWIVIYKMILLILTHFEESILKIREPGDILVALKNNEMIHQNLQQSNTQQSELFWD